jgi:hypothetical protein
MCALALRVSGRHGRRAATARHVPGHDSSPCRRRRRSNLHRVVRERGCGSSARRQLADAAQSAHPGVDRVAAENVGPSRCLTSVAGRLDSCDGAIRVVFGPRSTLKPGTSSAFAAPLASLLAAAEADKGLDRLSQRDYHDPSVKERWRACRYSAGCHRLLECEGKRQQPRFAPLGSEQLDSDRHA